MEKKNFQCTPSPQENPKYALNLHDVNVMITWLMCIILNWSHYFLCYLSFCPAQLKLLRYVLSMECLCTFSIRWEVPIPLLHKVISPKYVVICVEWTSLHYKEWVVKEWPTLGVRPVTVLSLQFWSEVHSFVLQCIVHTPCRFCTVPSCTVLEHEGVNYRVSRLRLE